MLGAEIEFFDAGDYPLRLTEAHFDRMVDIYRELKELIASATPVSVLSALTSTAQL